MTSTELFTVFLCQFFTLCIFVKQNFTNVFSSHPQLQRLIIQTNIEVTQRRVNFFLFLFFHLLLSQLMHLSVWLLHIKNNNFSLYNCQCLCKFWFIYKRLVSRLLKCIVEPKTKQCSSFILQNECGLTWNEDENNICHITKQSIIRQRHH